MGEEAERKRRENQKIVYGVIYVAKNDLKGKVYIGRTRQALLLRKRAHENLSKSSQFYFHRALKKYGNENFSWGILEECFSEDHLNSREVHWISKFKALDQLFGYNQAPGGSGGTCHREHRAKISAALKGKPKSIATRLAC